MKFLLHTHVMIFSYQKMGTWIFRSGDFSRGRFVLPNFFHF